MFSTEALILIGIIALLIMISLTIFGLLSYSGLFHIVEVKSGSPPLRSCEIAYKYLKGAYTSVLIGATFTEITSILPKATTLGIFYDDPDEVADDDQRCAVGCVLDEDYEEDDEMAKLLDDNEFRRFSLPTVSHAVLSSHPYTTPFSIRIAPTKVYPRLSEYITEKELCAYPMVEVYTENEILYMAPLSKQEAFFVPEALQDQEEKEMNQENDDDTEVEQDSDSNSNSGSEYSGLGSQDENLPPRKRKQQNKPTKQKKIVASSTAKGKPVAENSPRKLKPVKITAQPSPEELAKLVSVKESGIKERKTRKVHTDDSSFEELDYLDEATGNKKLQ